MSRFPDFLALHHYALLNGLIRMVAQTLFRPLPGPEFTGKILLVRKGTMGDHLCSLPLINSLKQRYPRASFEMLTQPRNNDVSVTDLVREGYFDAVWDTGQKSPQQLRTWLRSQQYDAVIELPQNLDNCYTQIRNALFFSLCGIGMGAGWAVSNTQFLSARQRLLFFDNEQDRLRKILLSYGLELTPDYDLSHCLRLSAVELPFSRYIVVAPGAKHESQRWPADRFRAVVEQLTAAGHHIVLLGNAFDLGLTCSWESPGLLNLCGKTSVSESAYIMQRARLTVCNDSGPMHLSYHSGTPVVAIFSTRNYPGKWYPAGAVSHSVIRAKGSLESIFVEEVMAHIEQQLKLQNE